MNGKGKFMRIVLIGNTDQKPLQFPSEVLKKVGENPQRDESLVQAFIDSANVRVPLFEFRSHYKEFTDMLVWLSDLPTLFMYYHNGSVYSYWIINVDTRYRYRIEYNAVLGEVLVYDR